MRYERDPFEVLCVNMCTKKVRRFRGGLIFKAHRLLHHSTLGLRVITEKQQCTRNDWKKRPRRIPTEPAGESSQALSQNYSTPGSYYHIPGSYQSLQKSIWYKFVEEMDLPSMYHKYSPQLDPSAGSGHLGSPRGWGRALFCSNVDFATKSMLKGKEVPTTKLVNRA